jgi:tRNA-Thr(GGU) m(6)t(6)A37 methyltransferase TsaA
MEAMPIQPGGARGVQGKIEILPDFVEGLLDLEGFSHVILLYHFHRTGESKLVVTPFLDSEEHGIFATRAPSRPNPIGLSIVRLLERKSNILKIENVDVLDGTPLLDIKPYVARFDRPKADRFGWLEKNQHQVQEKRSDKRFR